MIESTLKKEAELFGRGIGNMTRQHILEVLFDGPSTVNNIVSQTKYSQPLISQHLKILKQSNLVTDKRKGQEIFYEINIKTMRSFAEALVLELDIYEDLKL